MGPDVGPKTEGDGKNKFKNNQESELSPPLVVLSVSLPTMPQFWLPRTQVTGLRGTESKTRPAKAKQDGRGEAKCHINLWGLNGSH